MKSHRVLSYVNIVRLAIGSREYIAIYRRLNRL